MNLTPHDPLVATDFIALPRQTVHVLSSQAKAALATFESRAVCSALESEDAVLLDGEGLAELRGSVRVEILVDSPSEELESYFFDTTFVVRGCGEMDALPALATAHMRHMLVVNYVDTHVNWDEILRSVARIRNADASSLELNSFRCAHINIEQLLIDRIA